MKRLFILFSLTVCFSLSAQANPAFIVSGGIGFAGYDPSHTVNGYFSVYAGEDAVSLHVINWSWSSQAKLVQDDSQFKKARSGWDRDFKKYMPDTDLSLYTKQANFSIRANTAGDLVSVYITYKDGSRVGGSYLLRSEEMMDGRAKPVIYLYPEKETDISVKLRPKDPLTITIPKYTGLWNVKAQTDGRLYSYDDGREYDYLFWESKNSDRLVLTEGFVVESGNIENFFREKLRFLGLNNNEIDDFCDFWIPRFQEYPFYLINFADMNAITEMCGLVVTPEPDTVIRVYFNYQPLNRYYDFPEQQLEPAERRGYTLVEWGGALTSDPAMDAVIIGSENEDLQLIRSFQHVLYSTLETLSEGDFKRRILALAGVLGVKHRATEIHTPGGHVQLIIQTLTELTLSTDINELRDLLEELESTFQYQ